MLKAFELEENPGIKSEGFFFHGHYRRATNMRGDPPAGILNFSARDHSVCVFDLVFLRNVATGGFGWSSTMRLKISGRA